MKILMRKDKGEKWGLVESNDYSDEADLQDLLSESLEVISMDEIRTGAGPLVAAVREFSLPVGSIDLLAFTARGDIAIIECKLAKNTQAKREVIGQILDYAAHLWDLSYKDLDLAVQKRINQPLADWVHDQSDDLEWNEEEFRNNVSSALEDGNFILTIVVNEINEELNQIIRYVNSAGKPAFSFAALEMRRFNHSKIEMLVPHVFGPTHSPQKPPIETRKWDEPSFFEILHQKDPIAETVGRKILEWAVPRVSFIYWGEGKVTGAFVPILRHNDRGYQLFAVYTNGFVETYFPSYKRRPQFESTEKRLEILHRLNKIEGVSIPDDAIDRKPSIKLSLLAKPESLEKFLSVFSWMIDEIKREDA
jgi:hypothetical protein